MKAVEEPAWHAHARLFVDAPRLLDEDLHHKNTTKLACRQAIGIEVALLWDRTNGELTSRVTDAASGALSELPVSAEEALIAFHHPYAHAAVKGPLARWR